jgi:hypothetical protein
VTQKCATCRIGHRSSLAGSASSAPEIPPNFSAAPVAGGRGDPDLRGWLPVAATKAAPEHPRHGTGDPNRTYLMYLTDVCVGCCLKALNALATAATLHPSSSTPHTITARPVLWRHASFALYAMRAPEQAGRLSNPRPTPRHPGHDQFVHQRPSLPVTMSARSRHLRPVQCS